MKKQLETGIMDMYEMNQNTSLANNEEEFKHLKRDLEGMAKVKATDQSILRTLITIISDMKQSITDI